MRFSTPILINLAASLNIASAQACDGGTACGYYGTLCCNDDEICITNADNQAVCEVPVLSSETLVGSVESGGAMSTEVVGVSSDSVSAMSTPMMLVSTDSATVTVKSVLTPRPTQVTGVETSSSKTTVVDATGTSLVSSSTTQSANASGAEETASTTGAQSKVSTGSADASNAPASTTTTTGSGGRMESSWCGVVGVGIIVATVLMV